MRVRLHHELNAEPDSLTTAAFQAVRERPSPVRPLLVRQENTARSRSIPVPATHLIGRDRDVKHVIDLLSRSRLVTVTGVGGIGKTRLALQVAREIGDAEDDLVTFVGLAAHTDSATIADAVCEALGVSSLDTGREPIDELIQFLQLRKSMLLLDNCEHLITACAALADELLNHCAHARILMTSRHALGLTGETVWLVPSLALPPSVSQQPTYQTDALIGPASCAAVELFVDRASGACDSFRLTPATAVLVEDICRRLDGIPLAIELAAARVRSLSLEEILCRLQSGLRLLSGGVPTLLCRHKTLEAAFEWSWDLLSLEERALLRRLAVFVGGWTLSAAENVCSGGEIAPEEVVDLMMALVDKSLVVFTSADHGADDGGITHEARYHLLEPIRQFAAHRLSSVEEQEAVRARHRDFYLLLAEDIRPRLSQVGQELWFDRLEADHDNLRAALRWCRSQEDEVEAELRLVVALARLWDTHGHLREGRDHLEAALSRITCDLPQELRASALVHAGWSAYVQKDGLAARGHYGVWL